MNGAPYIQADTRHAIPKEGFQSITVSHAVYDRFSSSYLTGKEDLAAEGVRSITGYISNMIEEALSRDEAASKPTRLGLIHVGPGRLLDKHGLFLKIADLYMIRHYPV